MKKRLFIKLIAVILVVVTLFSTAALTISAANNTEATSSEDTTTTNNNRRSYTKNLEEINRKLDELSPKEKKWFKDSVKELASAKTADKAAGSIIKAMFALANDSDNISNKNVALETGAALINLAASCFGFGGIAEAITGGLLDIFKDKSPSEIELLKDYVSDRFDIVENGINDIRNDISDLSINIDQSFIEAVSKIEESIGESVSMQMAGDHVKDFTSSDSGHFNYNLLKNYLYGSSTDKNNEWHSSAYYDKLSRAIAENKSDAVIEEYYNALYDSLTTSGYERDPYINIMRKYIMDDGYAIYSIQRYYYDWLSYNRDAVEKKGKDVEWEAILFTLDVYRTMLGAEHCVLLCNNYFLSQIYLEYGPNPDSEAFYEFNGRKIKYTDILTDIDRLNSEEREKALIDQIVQDVIYILNMENSYILESIDGDFYTVNNVDVSTFGQVRTGQTIYMNRLSDEICEIFGLDPQKFVYKWSTCENNTGMLVVPENCESLKATLYYDGTEIYSITFKINNDDKFCGGNGTVNDPYLISTVEQFNKIEVGENSYDYANCRSVYYTIINDIDFQNIDRAPLGNNDNPFYGVLDGDGHVLKNLKIANKRIYDMTCIGLFAKIGCNGIVKNLNIDNLAIVSPDINSDGSIGYVVKYANVGAFAGINEGVVENCHTTNTTIVATTPYTESNVGGIIGQNIGGTICNCSVDNCDLKGYRIDTKNFSVSVGGIVAHMNGGKLSNVQTTNAKLFASGYSVKKGTSQYLNLGGIVGSVENTSDIKGIFSKNCNNVFVSNTANVQKRYDPYIPNYNIDNNVVESEPIVFPEKSYTSLTCFEYSGEVSKEYTHNGHYVYENQIYAYDEDFLKVAETYIEDGVENKRNILNISVDGNDGFSLNSYKILGYYGLDTLSSDKIDGEEHLVTVIFNATLKKEGCENRTVILSIDIPIVVEKIKPSELVVVEKPQTQYSDVGELITLDGGRFDLHWEDGSIDADVKPQIVSNKNITAWGTSKVEISYNGVNTTYEINATCNNHNYEETVVAAKCFREGYTEHTCTKCGASYVDNIINVIPHTIIIQNATAATCNTNGIGYTGNKYCTVCEEIVEFGTDIDVLQHSYDKIDDTHCKCGVCNAQNTIAPHTYKSVENEKYIYYVCTKCGYEPEPIPKATSANVSHIVVGQSYGLVDRDYEITVYVKMFNNPGITGLNLRIEYDQRLEFVRAEKGDVLKSSGTFEPAHAKGVIGIVSADAYATTEDGNLLKLVFKLPKDAKVTDKYPISISYGNEFTDSNADLISLVTADGYIKAVSHLPGDINSDEVVDMLDTTLLARYMAIRNTGDSELMNSFLESQHYNFSEFYADVDLDGYVNLPDLVIMLQYLVGNNTQELTSNEFEVILNPNNGSLDVETIIVKSYDENGDFGVYPELPIPSRPGYQFEGWYTSFDALDPKTVQVKAGDRVKYNPTFLYQTLYARWSEITSYTVVFDANGGNGSMQPSVHIHDTEKELPNNELTKTGYHFAGWNTKADGSGKWYANKEQVLNLVSQGVDSITLYAQWTPNNYTIHYDANGGVGTTPSSTHVYNTYAQLTSNSFSRIGYTFVEWNTKPDGSGASYSNLENVMNLVTADGGSLTLYAQWNTITYTIKYNLNGGSYQNGETYSVSYTVEALPSIPDLIYPTHPMYNTFEGWYEDSTFNTMLNPSTLTSSPRNLNLYAKWNLCKEYNYMSTTPDVTDVRVLIDWSNATSTDVAATRGNGVLSVANTVKELIIIGNPDLTYTNFSISLVDFAANQELVVCFDNFNFTTNVDGAIKTNGTDNGMILTIDVHGTCSINTSVAGGSIIKGFTNTLNFTGDGQITITGGTGGNGADGVTTKKCERGASGGNGSTGATTISASKIVVDENVTLIVFGGNGGKGGNGGNGWSALSVGDSQGGHAGAGGNGGDAISANSITINSGCIIATGGSGGKGGTGGKGDQYGSDDANGGNGGDGGDGGCSYNSSCVIVDKPGSSSFKPGAAGAAGNGGSGDGSDGHSGSNGSDGDAGAR